MNLKLIENVDAKPNIPAGVDISLAISYKILFCELNGEVKAVVSNDSDLVNAYQFLSKLDDDYEIVLLDDASYERLYKRFVEIKTDRSLTDVDTSSSVDEDEESLIEFLQSSTNLLDSEDSAPIIKFVNSLFYQAIKKNASDIHIEHHEQKGEVRFRVDGVLSKHVDLDKKVISLIVSRIKVISNLDISEKRVPQDGRTNIKIADKSLDIRVSVLPTYYGERVVMRILMQSNQIPTLNDLGFPEYLNKHYDDLLKHSHGMILVTGPTGSGKSTTLHSFLQQVASKEKNIITVEDPVEYNAQNVNQIQVNNDVGLTFSAGLRSILRQDPDIIMIGEIRDSETAAIAIKAALTGHLVFSTLHTNNSTSALNRLVDMGVDEFLVSSSVLGILAQRLVRKLCLNCKEKTTVSPMLINEFGISSNHEVYKAVGCHECNFTGYTGRQAVGELFILDDTVKSNLKDISNDFEIREFMKNHGMKTLSDELLRVYTEGLTSFDEILRVGVKEN
ncbi:MAG: Type IV fimbrial assembly, ATPase PilB [uncultured Campylobacterales bacterium]|uniref:Type IV fimbrial assembly, ATPase PilB n=1 Tax=uncultured Campylobacterales bacterium TaxID=352960 RepID=A0A6S6SPN0_9BACT|nr:MAG: Type IV fimbrial assembly, ATPase PilB [uncultured Campylobacterales bacterium]